MPPITNPFPSQLDQNQILQRAFNESTDRLRVDLAATITAGQLEVAISHVDDSIRLGDGTSLVTATTIGPDVGLDVNVLGGSISIGAATTPAVANISAATAGLEYSYSLPASTNKFTIKARGTAKMRLAYSSGATSTTYLTIPPGSSYTVEDLDASVTLYFQTNKASEIVEIESWS